MIMKAALPPILLTSSAFVADYAVKLKDPALRINHTIESVEKWLSVAPGIHLVICDGSGFDFSRIINDKFPQANIECLFFETDKNLVQFHGKGYGEGEIIKHALLNSTSLKQSDFFVKCTAKLWVQNFQDCLDEWNGIFLCKATFLNVFSIKSTILDHIDTRFYMVNKDFYMKYFFAAHLHLGGTTGLSIEDTFLESVLVNGMKKVLFNTPPVICGVGGGTGKYYNNTLTKIIKEILRAKFVKNNPNFRHLFNEL